MDVVCLQDTKLEFISLNTIRSLWNCCQVGWSYFHSKEASGGILVMWDKRVAEKVDECGGLHNVEDGYQWFFASVYGPNTNSERRGMWDELDGLCSLWNLPWCIRGDFNVTHFPSKQLGGSSSN